LNANVAAILDKIKRFEISSDYDPKDQVFGNYHSTIDQHSNPEIFLELDSFDSPVEFKIIWYNGKKNILKEEDVSLNRPKEITIINRKLFNQTKHIDLNSTGIFEVEIKHLEQFVLRKKFLVLPSKINYYEDRDKFKDFLWKFRLNSFWKFDSLCFNYPEKAFRCDGYNFFDNLFPQCHEKHWSTLYPDPKSDFSINANENRIQI
jgi:hypothetical protein